jgi:hypothetical protein
MRTNRTHAVKRQDIMGYHFPRVYLGTGGEWVKLADARTFDHKEDAEAATLRAVPCDVVVVHVQAAL